MFYLIITVNPEWSKPFLIIKRNDVELIIYSDDTIVDFSIQQENQTNENGLLIKITSDSNDGNIELMTNNRDGQKYIIEHPTSEIIIKIPSKPTVAGSNPAAITYITETLHNTGFLFFKKMPRKPII